MAERRQSCENASHSSDLCQCQLGVGAYVGRIVRSATSANYHLSTVSHPVARKLPDHAHDWPFLSTLLRGSYASRTRTRDMEFKRGVAVYHPRAFQHRDEIGRDGGIFFGIQLNPEWLDGLDRARPDVDRDVSTLEHDEAYVLLGALYGAFCTGSDELALQSLTAELASCLFASPSKQHGARPAWIERTKDRLREEAHVSLEELSRDAGVHATTLTRVFRRHERCSIGEFHARKRARRAFFAVVGSATPLSDICHSAGYADQSHMTRAFKRVFAATPGQLRRSLVDA